MGMGKGCINLLNHIYKEGGGGGRGFLNPYVYLKAKRWESGIRKIGHKVCSYYMDSPLEKYVSKFNEIINREMQNF